MIFQGGGGSGPPVPPLDPHLKKMTLIVALNKHNNHHIICAYYDHVLHIVIVQLKLAVNANPELSVYPFEYRGFEV